MNRKNSEARLIRIFRKFADIHGRCQGVSQNALARRKVIIDYITQMIATRSEEEINAYIEFVAAEKARLFPSLYHQRVLQLRMAKKFILLPKMRGVKDMMKCIRTDDKMLAMILLPDFSQHFIECDPYELLEYSLQYIKNHNRQVDTTKYEAFLRGDDIGT